MKDRTLADLLGRSSPEPRQLFLAPLVGLGYIIAVPFFGLATLISLSIRRSRQLAIELRHHSAQATTRVW